MESFVFDKIEDYTYAEVLIDSFSGLENQTFTYLIPDDIKAAIHLGTPVIVPFGENQAGGYIVELKKDSLLEKDISVKEIISAGSDQIIEPEYIEFLKWAADYYSTTFLSMLKAAIPSGILTKAKKVVKVADNKLLDDFCSFQAQGEFRDFCLHLIKNPEIKVSSLKTAFGLKSNRYIRKLLSQGLIKVDFTFETRLKYKKQLFVSFLHSEADISSREQEVLAYIQKNGAVTLQEAVKEAGTTPILLRKLEAKGCINISEQIILRTPQNYTTDTKHATKLNLNQHQEKVLNRFIEVQNQDKKDKVILLHGVTGSGKTEVYLQTIENVLNQGKTSIVLVPEISLTPQTVNRFRSRFGDCIAVLHSALSEGERFDEWYRIKSGMAKIVIGARSAIFAPCKDLGLIIIDEEHESSYKQDRNPRYNAKTIALKRAEINNATVILGSATPAIESYFQALNDKNWLLLEMPERVENKNMPEVLVVDMKQEFLEGNKSMFSRKLEQALRERVENKEQSIVFINRRGYSPFVLCRDCGYCVKCDNCSVSMVYHVVEEYLKCHYCGDTRGLPRYCPSCRGANIRHFGIGTQKIEAVVTKLFPGIRVARLDRDTTTRKDAHFEILDKFSKGEFDILIGTQMVAKGLDFPNVTLVGIVAADTALNIPDFRAAERTFQLITQVAGRSGRGDKKGLVISQTFATDHISIQTAREHDYLAFYINEINARKELLYPPFSQLVNIIIADTSENQAKDSASVIGKYLKSRKSESIIKILGPIPAGIPKIKSYYRFQVMIKTADMNDVREIIKDCFKTVKLSSGTRIGIDIDPLNMM